MLWLLLYQSHASWVHTARHGTHPQGLRIANMAPHNTPPCPSPPPPSPHPHLYSQPSLLHSACAPYSRGGSGCCHFVALSRSPGHGAFMFLYYICDYKLGCKSPNHVTSACMLCHGKQWSCHGHAACAGNTACVLLRRLLTYHSGLRKEGPAPTPRAGAPHLGARASSAAHPRCPLQHRPARTAARLSCPR